MEQGAVSARRSVRTQRRGRRQLREDRTMPAGNVNEQSGRGFVDNKIAKHMSVTATTVGGRK